MTLSSHLLRLLLFGIVLLFVLIDATAQGGITERNRRFVPPTEQPAVNLDLHWLLPCLLILLLLTLWLWQGWHWPVAGVLLRLALFDPVMNLRKGDPVFALGTSAKLDLLLARAPWLSAVLRCTAAVGAVGLVFFL